MPAGVAGSCLMTVSRTSSRKVGSEAGGRDGENGMGGRSRWSHICRGVAKEWSSGNCNVILYKILPVGSKGEGGETYCSVFQT